MKELDLKKSVANLVREYPELKEILVEIGFQDIMKPAALKLMGSIMTLRAALSSGASRWRRSARRSRRRALS